MPLVLDFREIACDLQQPPLVRRNRMWLLAEALVEIGDRRVQRTRNFIQLGSRDAIHTLLVFLRLLPGHTENFSELALRHTSMTRRSRTRAATKLSTDVAFLGRIAIAVVVCPNPNPLQGRARPRKNLSRAQGNVGARKIWAPSGSTPTLISCLRLLDDRVANATKASCAVGARAIE
jgi:hypothetical protein